MSSALRLCPKCGREIPADAPEGGCPGCLLEAAFGTLANEEESLLDSARHATRSERLEKMLGELGDYELLEEVGRGGQGVVFRARQKSLNRTVALKVISLGQWASEAHVKRFRREAEAAASLDHPSIVPIYEVGERQGSCYFSMKFVEGGQLDEVVRRVPMSIRQAAELIAKVARTVHYAHEHGILHRDIKPGNILLDVKGEPNLTDFGLARLLETESTVTRTLEVLGTPSYMAPEQAGGEHTKISKATDVYGLGAVLYQLLTGHPPFAGGTSYQTIRLLLDTEPRQPRSWNRKIDRELSTICLKCLEKDPKRRYPSALALAEDLDHWLMREPIRAKPSGFFTHSRKWVQRNPSTTVFVTLLVALGASLGVVVWNHKSVPLIPKSVAVLPFENLSEDPNNAYFADGIQEEILTRLASVADLKVISRTSTERYQSKPRNLAEIAKQLGVANILEGSVQKAADQVRVNVQLINAQTDSHLWADTYDRRLADIFAVETEVAKAIADALQAKLTGGEQRALAVKPTNNSEAYDAYLRGLALEARTTTSPDDSQKAVGFYERAVQLDPAFAPAWARLSRANAHVYFGGLDSTTTRRDATERALNTAQKLQPNSPETLLAQAYYQYWVRRDYELAKATFGRVRELLPGSSDVPAALALIARRQGHWDESVAYWEQTLALDPRNTEWLALAAQTYANLRQFPAALKTYDRLLDIVPNDPETVASEAEIYQAEGNPEQAGKLLVGVNAQTPSFIAFLTKMNQLFLERQFDEAIRLIHSRLTEYRDLSDIERLFNPFFLVLAQENAGDIVGARATAQQMLRSLEPLSQKDPDNPNFAQALSLIHAVLGQKDAAIKEAERAITLLPSGKDAVDGPRAEENLAFVEVLVGDKNRAIPRLQHLLQVPYSNCLTPALLRLNPQWDPLRGDPGFQKLCEEKLDKSIAVLPFENHSRDPDNAYFADGIQDEILTRLSKIADLKVISRTSTQHYKSAPENLPEIARQLGVANILEGSVQKSGDAVRVNVQLIKAVNDSHLWADTFDRKLTDIFSVESEVAKAIAEQLNAKLTGAEQKAVADKPTQNLAAYDAYLRGLAFAGGAHDFRTSLLKSIEAFENAVRLDPEFAVAWAHLSRQNGLAFINNVGQAPERREAARKALDMAIKFGPELVETQLAKAFYKYYCERDYEGAKAQLESIRRQYPNNAVVWELLGGIARRQGQWEQSRALYAQAVELDPQNIFLLTDAALTDLAMRDAVAAQKHLGRALDLSPQNSTVISFLAQSFQLGGDIAQAQALLDTVQPKPGDGIYVSTAVTNAILLRKYDSALAMLKAQLEQPDALGSSLGVFENELGDLERHAGNTAEATMAYQKAKQAVNDLLRAQPENSEFLIQLAWAEACLGDKANAIAHAQQAIAVLPASKDAFVGPGYEDALARIEAHFGEKDSAIGTLQHLLSISYGSPVTRALLRIDPDWDNLRKDPRFEKIVTSLALKKR